MSVRSTLAYRLFNLAGRILPPAERTRLLRVLATGDPDDPRVRASLAGILKQGRASDCSPSTTSEVAKSEVCAGHFSHNPPEHTR